MQSASRYLNQTLFTTRSASARHQQARRSSVTVTAMKATWKGATIAESDKTIVVENNHYFPPDSIKKEYFKESSHHTTCGWKGVCSYYDVVVDGEVNKDAAWYYPDCKDAAKNIEGYVAFWKGVQVTK